MPQCDFFLSKADGIRLIDFVLRSGGWLVPDTHYATPHYLELKTAEACFPFLETRPLFFVLHKSYLKTPLSIVPLYNTQPERGYVIIQREGGPTIEFLCPGEYSDGPATIVAPAMLAHHPTFFNPETGKDEKAPDALRAYYRKLVTFMKEGFRRTEPSGFWIGREAKELVSNASARLVGPFGHEYRIKD